MPLDPRIEAVRKEYGLAQDDFWQLPQAKNVWCVKHAALEVVAAKAGIEFDDPIIIEADTANGIAVVSVRGRHKSRSIFSTGEASPKNCRNAYPWAMAEKRAVDRVILKLIGIHGLVYSEDEMDNSGKEVGQHISQPAEPPAKSSAQLKRDGEWERVSSEIANAMNDVSTFGQFEELKASYRAEAVKNGWNKAFLAALADLFAGYEKDVSVKVEADNDTVSEIQNQFAGARVVDERYQHPVMAGE